MNKTIEYLTLEAVEPMLVKTYDYEEDACVFDIGEVIDNREENPHHFKFIERNESFKVLNEHIIEKAENGILTTTDMHEYKEIVRMWNDELWECHLKPFAISEAKTCFSGQNDNFGKVYDDAIQEMALKYLEKLPDYNPYRAKPTTYFKMSFKAAIADLKAKKKNISQHYAYQYSLINEAFYRLFKEYGVQPDKEALQQASGLSPATFKKTLEVINSSYTVDVDALSFRTSDYGNMPEVAALENERSQIIYDAVEEVLENCTEEEKAVFHARISSDGEIKTFPDIAEQLNMKQSRVRRLFAGVQRELQNNETLRELYNHSISRHKQEYLNSMDDTNGKDACDNITSGIKRGLEHKERKQA